HTEPQADGDLQGGASVQTLRGSTTRWKNSPHLPCMRVPRVPGFFVEPRRLSRATESTPRQGSPTPPAGPVFNCGRNGRRIGGPAAFRPARCSLCFLQRPPPVRLHRIGPGTRVAPRVVGEERTDAARARWSAAI